MKVVLAASGYFIPSVRTLYELVRMTSDVLVRASPEKFRGVVFDPEKAYPGCSRWVRKGVSYVLKDGVVYSLPDTNNLRAHPDFIKVVEKWGDQACILNTLRIVEVPDDIEWRVELEPDEDRREIVRELGRTWG